MVCEGGGPSAGQYVAITGGSGFIGRHLCRALVAAGWRLRVHVRARARMAALSVAPDDVVEGNLADAATWQRLLAGVGAVIHCAGTVRGRRAGDFVGNWQWAPAFVAAVTAMGESAPPPWLLYISSLAAREPGLSWYAGSKRDGERLLAGYARACILRPPAVYGPGDTEIAPLLALFGRGLAPVAGAENARFSLLHVDDLTTAVMALIAVQPVDATLTISDGARGGYRWLDLIAQVAALTGRRPLRVPLPGGCLRLLAHINVALSALLRQPPMLTPEKVNELMHPDWTCDHGALTALCGWQPRIDLAHGLAAELASLRARQR